eukprot:CAMPEP_0196721456 /NCGR_PEP_ID=MMETSP1091-20130531/3997_1 /TAXON_ID=302021 /ORGANISM="Rhodomonas sp., Strain CCMP768" /LENGTH=63 /DNA_ID=CAMNT_0042062917 /DNA_START=122 /DNA_END=313 /DNA_ORIENTATION=+
MTLSNKQNKDAKLDRHTAHVPYSDASKKGGAGKGNWGVPGEGEDGVAVLDKKDPNYDSGDDKQ